MEELSLATPSILFSAISLIMLAYTNRFLSYAQLIRNISAEYHKNPSEHILHQIRNLRRRLYLTRSMQILGISSLLLCVVCTFFIYIGWQTVAIYTNRTPYVYRQKSLRRRLRTDTRDGLRRISRHL